MMKNILVIPTFRLIDRIGMVSAIVLAAVLLASAQLALVWILVIDKSTYAGFGLFVIPALLMTAAVYILCAFAGWARTTLEQLCAPVRLMGTGDLSFADQYRDKLRADTEASRAKLSVVHMRDNLVSIVTQVRASADNIVQGAREISVGYSNLSRRTEEQAAALEETAASMEELSATVKQNAYNCDAADKQTTEAKTRAEQAGQSMQHVTSNMSRIEADSARMSEIISLIETIAFQTNILSLNAAVEAARAGEQGRGFGVIAAEVRSLAKDSAVAAEQIKSLIETAGLEVGEGTAAVHSAEQAVGLAIKSVYEMSQRIASIAAASKEQSVGMDGVNRALAQIDNVTQQNAALVKAGAAVSDEFHQEAARLVETVGAFRLGEDRSAEARARTKPQPPREQSDALLSATNACSLRHQHNLGQVA